MPYKDPEKARLYNKLYQRNYRKKYPSRVSATAKRSRDNHKESVDAYQALYRLTHKEQIKRKNARYHLRNRQKLLELARAYYLANKEEILAKAAQYRLRKGPLLWLYQQWYRQTFPERYAESQRRSRRKHALTRAIRFAQWRLKNPFYWRITHAARRARLRQLPASFTPEQRQFMLQHWRHTCAICGREEGLWHTLADDHWVALSAPGCPGTVATNMLPLCHTKRLFPQAEPGCNNMKYNKDPHAWLLERFGARKAKKIEKAIATYFAIVAERFGIPSATEEAAD